MLHDPIAAAGSLHSQGNNSVGNAADAIDIVTKTCDSQIFTYRIGNVKLQTCLTRETGSVNTVN